MLQWRYRSTTQLAGVACGRRCRMAATRLQCLMKRWLACRTARVCVASRGVCVCGTGKKTKAAAKKGKGNQWQTLESMDISRDMVPKFVDPVFWLHYFPPLAKQDLLDMGVKVDWRRSTPPPHHPHT